jgi:Holliday junction resolvasome RuvABC ATP-dependent DNA helicase subunit
MSDTFQKILSDIFTGIVGQDNPKKEIGFYVESYQHSRMIPNMLITAPKGQGKTTIARALAKGLVEFDEDGKVVMVPSKKDPKVMKPKRKTFIEVNCSTLKSVKQFINGLIIPFVQDKDVTLLFDEASEIPKDVTMALLTILNPNPENRTTFSMDEYVCDFDFRRQTFIFATSESQRVFHALADRLERITLEEYTYDHLAEIVQKGMPDIIPQGKVLLDVAPVLRGNARAAQKMANKIVTFCGHRKHFTYADWARLSEILSIHPLGLNALEIQILRYLAQNGTAGTSLTGLSAKTGMSRESLQKDSELYLQKHNLMEISTTGRIITGKGLDYLKQLDSKTVCAAT